MESEYLKEIEKLRNDCSTLEMQVKLLVRVEMNLRRTKAELANSNKKIEEYNRTLEQRVEERTNELKKAQKQLIENAHRAGMAEIASGVVHNIGNILNSISICSEEIYTTIKSSKISEFKKANDMLQQNEDRLAEFLSNDTKGKMLLDYFLMLETALTNEQEKLRDETTSILQKLDIMRSVILTQQDYAIHNLLFEDINLTTIVEDALKILQDQLGKAKINILKQYDPNREIIVSVQKSKLIQILINLFTNASEAMINNDTNNKVITIDLHRAEDNTTLLSISDNGEGIKTSNKTKIFTHGFTTKKDGHGFGLHNSANFMAEMGGSITAESEGDGYGATFTLCFSPSKKSDKN